MLFRALATPLFTKIGPKGPLSWVVERECVQHIAGNSCPGAPLGNARRGRGGLSRVAVQERRLPGKTPAATLPSALRPSLNKLRRTGFRARFFNRRGGCPLERCHFVPGTPAIFPGDFYRFGHRPPVVSPAWRVVRNFRHPPTPPPPPPPVVKGFRHEIGVEHVRFIPGPFWGPFPVSKRPLDEVRETWWKVKNG